MARQGLDKATVDRLVRRAQTEFAYAYFTRTALMLLVNLVIIDALIWANIGATEAKIWMGLVIILLLIRTSIYLRYRRSAQDNPKLTVSWNRLFMSGALSTTLLIGVVSVFAYPHFEVVHKTIFLFVTAGLTAGALTVLALHISYYVTYILIPLAPVIIYSFMDPSVEVQMIGIVALVYVMTMTFHARRFNRILIDSLYYRFQSDALAEQLRSTNKDLSSENQELHQISTTDELTEVYNRRYFNKRFEEIWADHRRENTILAGLMIDVDYFKAYNDTYGHLKGDDVLRDIAQSIHQVIWRPRDFIARFGGEEFIVLLPTTDISGANALAERIHSTIKEINIEHDGNPDTARITVSIGVATIMPRTTDSPDIFINKLDKALYVAKSQGRNRTFIGE
ncbi:MAG: diguanylate cyclase [Gammaproteobacteria bacterium]|nr:diguanylate cyclase [Gammaproteobacteria bacterium]